MKYYYLRDGIAITGGGVTNRRWGGGASQVLHLKEGGRHAERGAGAQKVLRVSQRGTVKF